VDHDQLILDSAGIESGEFVKIAAFFMEIWNLLLEMDLGEGEVCAFSTLPCFPPADPFNFPQKETE